MSGSDRDIQELEQLSDQLQQLDAQRQRLQAEVERLRAVQREMTEAIDALETLESGSRVQVPVGGGAYVRATVDDIDEVIVELGGGFAAEQDQDAAIESLKTRRELMSGRTDDVRERISEIESNISSLEGSARQLQARVQQQLQQQMQQQQRRRPDENGG